MAQDFAEFDVSKKCGEHGFHAEYYGCVGSGRVFLPYGLQSVCDGYRKNTDVDNSPPTLCKAGQSVVLKRYADGQVHDTGHKELSDRKQKDGHMLHRPPYHDDMHGP